MSRNPKAMRQKTTNVPTNSKRSCHERARRALAMGLTLLVGLASSSLAEKDSVTVGTVPLAAAGDTVQVPLYIRDVSGTLLGGDAGSGRTIQDIAMMVRVQPPAAVTSWSLQKAGVLVGPTPVFEQLLSPGNERGAVIAFSESGDPISFTLDAPIPGDLVAQLEVTIAPVFLQGTIDLSLVASKTGLGNQSGTLAEKPADGRLTLVDGQITVDQSLFVDGFESGDTSAWSNTIP